MNETIPIEELDELKREAEKNGKDPSEIPTTRVVTKMIKKQIKKEHS